MKFDKNKIDSHIIYIIGRLQKAGFETYLVGGAIRDLMLQREPKDYDISTAATPEEVRDVFGRRYARIIGKRFRLVHYYHGHEIIEISTFRQAPKPQLEDEPPRDNDYGTAEEDAWRRDFTVNAMFYDPVNDKIIDFTKKGLIDIKTRTVRVVGKPIERFEEDPVRILRALKLVGQYGFSLEKKTAKALQSALPLITQCSHSRLSLELEKIIKRPYSEEIFTAFANYGFLAYYLPFMSEKWETPECKYMIELLAERNKRLLKGIYRDSVSLAIATAVFPFAEKNLTEPEHEMRGWYYFPGIERELKNIIVKLFSPYHFPKRIVASAIGTLLIQPAMLNMDRMKRTLTHKRYLHARELMTLQNNIKWHDEKLEEFWPKQGKRSPRNDNWRKP
jgi:poly(A) polymerase